MPRIVAYAKEVVPLSTSKTTTEATYYPALKGLLADLLRELRLPSDVRTNTSESREGGGTDAPDVSIYDDTGDGIVVPVEVKLPKVDLEDLATSTERNDQIGRYLAQTGAVLLCNIRSFGLLTVKQGWAGRGAVPPSKRVLERVINVWPSHRAFEKGILPDKAAGDELRELVEDAVTRFAKIRTPQMLARVLARQARHAKADLPADLGATVKGLREDFGKSLGITFEGEDGDEFFRSSLIQTVFYALFAGWALGQARNDKAPLRWRDLADTLTIPVLGGLFHEIKHPARLKALKLEPWLDRAEATLGRVEANSFFQRLATPRLDEEFDPSRQAANAILYFYEPFLESFDPELRKQLGVWYTPPEIVRYQVRRVDQILREKLDRPLGLADPDVIILDPACGTGAYLIETLLCINDRLREQGAGGDLGRRIVDALCHRVIGFEILTAPFVIAHLQILLTLSALKYEMPADGRLAVFLTNALTGWDGTEQLKLSFPDLVTEHEASRRVKREARIIVVLGNPPYNRFVAAPIEEESTLVDHYKGIQRGRRGEQLGQSRLYTEWHIRKQLLNDLYIRFFRLAEKRIGEAAEYGIVSFISNSSFLIGRSHPLMRESLLTQFDDIWVDNLHGNRLASERTPSGESCETVFNMEGGGPGIKVGTAITTMVKRREKKTRRGIGKVHVRDFWGNAEAKRRALHESLGMDEWTAKRRSAAAVAAEGPRAYESLVPTRENRFKLALHANSAGYDDWPAVDELLSVSIQGVNPARGLEGGVVETVRSTLEQRMTEYFSSMPFKEFARKHPVLCEQRARYEPEALRDILRHTTTFRRELLQPYLLFTLDSRHVYYETEGKLLTERSPRLWENLQKNEFLISVTHARRPSERLPLFSSTLFDYHLQDHGAFGFPAEVESPPDHTGLFTKDRAKGKRHANLEAEAWKCIARAWKLDADLHSDDAKREARHLIRAILAVCHAPTYQENHADSLAEDMAHVPVPAERKLFNKLASAGGRIATLLDPLMDASGAVGELIGSAGAVLGVPTAKSGGQVASGRWAVEIAYYAAAKGRWEEREFEEREGARPEWGDKTGDLWINDDVFFRNVPERIWRYELGGYPVLKKWLGYRDAKRADGRELSLEEVQHFRGMIQRIGAMLVLHPELDALYAEAAANPMKFES